MRLFRIISIPSKFVIDIVWSFCCVHWHQSSALSIPSKSRDLADVNNKFWRNITSLKLYLFSFFICGCQHHQRKTICLYVLFLISDRQCGTEHQHLFSGFLGVSRLEFLLCTLTPEVQHWAFHRNHVIWRTKITKLWRNGNDSKWPYCFIDLENVKFHMSYLQQYTNIIKMLTLKTYFS
jgi:hypothetical protein